MHIAESFDKTIMKKLINKDNPLIIEIGAHHGEDSVLFRRMYPNATLILVEPDPRCLLKLRKLGLNATIIDGVISDIVGMVSFNMSDGHEGVYHNWDGSGSVMIPTLHKEFFPDILFEEVINVRSYTLDHLFEDTDHIIDFIWMDVQGAEGKVISGGLKTLSDKTRYIYTEVCQKELYEGAPNSDKIMGMIGSKFELIGMYEVSEVVTNILLKNVTL